MKKILEVCPFSSGICGVWSRVKEESKYLVRAGYEVRIFSSDIIKGDDNVKAKDYEVINKIEVSRYPAKKLGGESFMSWFKGSAIDEAVKYSPDIIIAHNYRHPHTSAAIAVAQKLRDKGKECKVFLVTHAPFVEGNTTRSFLSKIMVNLYDLFIGPRVINNFDKIITITNWENKYIDELTTSKDKIAMIPNGLPDEFFTKDKLEDINNSVLFLGRVAPIKNIITILEAAKILPDVNFSIVRPVDEKYMKLLNEQMITIPKNVTFYGPVYDISKKIEMIDRNKILVLPSLREAMPQVLLEGMSRGKIVISSNTEGAKEIITNKKDGFIFEIGNANELACLIKENMKNKEHIQMNASEKAKRYSWNNLINKYVDIIEA